MVRGVTEAEGATEAAIEAGAAREVTEAVAEGAAETEGTREEGSAGRGNKKIEEEAGN